MTYLNKLCVCVCGWYLVSVWAQSPSWMSVGKSVNHCWCLSTFHLLPGSTERALQEPVTFDQVSFSFQQETFSIKMCIFCLSTVCLSRYVYRISSMLATWRTWKSQQRSLKLLLDSASADFCEEVVGKIVSIFLPCQHAHSFRWKLQGFILIWLLIHYTKLKEHNRKIPSCCE